MPPDEPAPPPPGAPESTEPALSPAALKRRALLGGVALAMRTVVMQFVVLGGAVVLARKLRPGEFGAYAIVQFTLTFLTVFGDAGLGGALIQRKERPSQRELSSVFWMQAAIGLVIMALAWLLSGALSLVHGLPPDAPWLVRLVAGRLGDLPVEAPWLLRILAIDFFVTSLRVVPTILMERELQFARLSALDIVGSLAFHAVAAVCALQGLGIWSLSAGVVAQMTASFGLAYALRPWRPSLVVDRELLRPLLRFGIPFQLKFVVGLALSAITPLWGGFALGATSVGLLNWAQSTAHFPLRLVDIVSRVSFPLYSRIIGEGGDPRALAAAVERSVRITAFGTLFFAGLMLGIGPQVTRIIYSEQWLAALPLLYIYASTITIGFLSPVLATVFDALGDPRTILRMSVVVTVGIWATVVPTSLAFGAMGFALGYVAWMVLGNVAMLIITRRRLPEARVARQLVGPAAGAVVTALVARFGLAPLIAGPFSLTASIFASAAVFLVASSAVDPGPLRDVWGMVRGRK